MSTSDPEGGGLAPPGSPEDRRRFDLPRPHLSTAAKVITATVTTGAALVAIVSGILNVQSRVAGDVVVTGGTITLRDVRFEEAMMPAESAGPAGADPPSVSENRVTFTVESHGGSEEVLVEYALFDAATFRRIGAGSENAEWGSLGFAGESNINLWIDVPVDPEGRCIFARIYLVPVMDPERCIPECAPIARFDVADSPPFDSSTGAPCMASTPPVR